jgi:hypothetical protein
MKKVVAVILSALLAVLAGAVFAMIWFRLASKGSTRADGLIPVEKISGIHTKATLKPGCVVSEGSHFPFDDNGIRCHCMRISGVLAELSGEVDNSGLPVSGISIIDVYGDKCTITFTCTDDHERYACYDYPLANLNYNKAKVDAANDGIKVEFYGSRYTLAK